MPAEANAAQQRTLAWLNAHPALMADAYNLRLGGMSFQRIQRDLGFPTVGAVRGAVQRYAAEHHLPDPVARRSVRQAARYAGRAGLEFDVDAFAALNEQVVETVGGAVFTGRTFGVEIEFRRPTHGGLTCTAIVAALAAQGVRAEDRSTRYHSGPAPAGVWKLEYDGSTDKELVSPILAGRDGLREVRTVMNVLRTLGCRVTRSEGMHVHIYAGDLTPVQTAAVFRFYADRQAAFDKLVPASRRGSQTYTNPVTDRDAVRVESYARQGTVVAPRSTRYLSVNLHAYARFQTIEFRQQAGTLNGRKSNDWTEALLGIYAAVEAGNETTCPVDLWGMLAWMVEHQHVKQATADRLIARAAAYGFARPEAVVEHGGETTVERTVEQGDAVDGPTLDVWASCACAACTLAREAAASGTARVTVH